MSATIRSTSVQATVVYDLDKPYLLGAVHVIDRVIVEYSHNPEDDALPYIDVTLKGWRLTSKMTVDRRQKARETVYIQQNERESFAREELGIDYEADLAKVLGDTALWHSA